MNTLCTKRIRPVQAPCLIAYRDLSTGYFWLRPYVDLTQKNKIWGIALNGQVFHLVHQEDGNWYQATRLGDEKSRAKMPSTTVIDIALHYRREFDMTAKFLQELGIKAEPWKNGWYWTNEDDNDQATVLDMGNGRIEFIPKKMKNGYVRLVSHYTVKKPDVMAYPLAHLVDNHLEISSDFRAELKHKIWGIHVLKGYLCMKTTFEPQRMTNLEGLALAKSLSNATLDVTLPSKDNLEEVAKEKDAINDTLAKLSAYGVKVDAINMKEIFWLTDSLCDKDGFLSYGNRFIRQNEPCLCRLFAKNKGKNVVI
jgi:hypothetical protein